MSQITVSGNASGTGTFTIASPNSNTNRTLTLPDASGTILTNSGTEAGAFSTLAVAGNNVSAVNGINFRNRIINGDMVIDQRNNGAAINNAPDGTWAVDRWVRYQNVGASNVGRNLNSVTPPAGFTNYLGIQISTAGTATSGQYTNFQHYVEGFNSADLAWGTASAQAITISFWVRSSITGTQGFALQNASSALGYPFTVTINSANTWEYKTVTIPGPTTGTWDTTNGRGITLIADLGMGSSFRFTAGSWQSGNVQGATGANSLNQTINATFYITGVQLEAGSVATPFERLPYGTELMLCQRYYQTNTTAVGGAGSATAAAVSCVLMSEMRAAPTATLLNGTNALDELYTAQRTVSSLGGLWGNFDNVRSVGILLNSSSLTTQRMVTLFSGRVGLSSEL